MIKAALIFHSKCFAYSRMYNSMKKYLPSDVCLDVSGFERALFTIRDYDIAIGHIGSGVYHPHWACISPKAVLSERFDDVTLSWFTDKDLFFTYRPDCLDMLYARGINAVLMARPVDNDIFYAKEIPKRYDIMVIQNKSDWLDCIFNVVRKCGYNCIVMDVSKKPIDHIMYDVCMVGTDDEKMCNYYNSSRFVMSPVDNYEYADGCYNAGFEVGFTEAAFCGTPSLIIGTKGNEYLHFWHGLYSRFIPDSDIEAALYRVLSPPHKPLPGDIIKKTIVRYNAKYIWDKFWVEVRNIL